MNTVGPVWEGNQVWFILGGGAIFAAWPPLCARQLSGVCLGDVLAVLAVSSPRLVGVEIPARNVRRRLA
ncbi:MAG: cytochrome d ubiquinol oxidase subunit II [Gemmobacter sp.]|nr:cytochrome d ubiquinol oxidase subunit II [Gemmobacter sp.]